MQNLGVGVAIAACQQMDGDRPARRKLLAGKHAVLLADLGGDRLPQLKTLVETHGIPASFRVTPLCVQHLRDTIRALRKPSIGGNAFECCAMPYDIPVPSSV